ncbi:ejaculatory bulb-specific protein 3 [Megalopta genalis]|uniref:ejaculatory bulb-specific protein 3 n=1 Tax=Megalopta genalis TaxID=115081 RepID=UPI003FD04660
MRRSSTGIRSSDPDFEPTPFTLYLDQRVSSRESKFDKMSHQIKIFLTVAVTAILASTFVQGEDESEEVMYSSKYDYLDVDEILNNDKLRKQYENCYMDTAPCNTPESLYIKEHLPEAFTTNCKKCTEKQVEFFNKVTDWYKANDMDAWNTIVKRTLERAKEEAEKRRQKE